MLVDYHVHSKFSDDSEELMESVIEQAIKLGYDELCFTDHVDYGIKLDHEEYKQMSLEKQEKYTGNYNVDYPNYFSEIESLRKKYQDKIIVKQGLEFGIQVRTIPQYEKLFRSYDLDFVILSCHQVDDKEFWTYEFQEGKTPEEYNREYYEEIYLCISLYKDYSVLGHLDMIQRYNNPIYPFEESKEIIQKILKRVILDGKGIEVNTSSFRYGLDDLMPATAILKLYYQLGGKVITIGSDCHKAGDFGDHIEYVKEKLKEIGFKEFCTFEKMKPIFHPL